MYAKICVKIDSIEPYGFTKKDICSLQTLIMNDVYGTVDLM